jgi:uncharacterized protein YndB with AHSA1/START domain
MSQTMYDTEPGREIRPVTIAAGQGRAAVYTRTFDATVADVWEACTTPGRLSRWFLTLSGDLRQGGRFDLSNMITGDILRCDPPHALRVSWEYPEHPTDEVELRLRQTADGLTLLELEHATVKTTEERDGDVLDALINMSSGWEPALVALDLDLHGELPADTTLASFSERPEVVAVIDRARSAWGQITAEGGGA